MPGDDGREPSAAGTSDTLRVGLIGLGLIGVGIATCLEREGRALAVYDIREDAAKDLPGAPVQLASPAAVAGVSDVVLLAVVDDQQVRDVVTGPDGLLSAAKPGLVIIVTSTVSVEVIRELAQVCERSGATLLDCAVTRGRDGSQHGLIALVGGPDEHVARVKAVLGDFAAQVHHCGPVGTGMACKLANQIVIAGRWRAAHEALELGTAAGVDPATLIEIIEASSAGTDHSGLQRYRTTQQSVDSFGRQLRQHQRNLGKDMRTAQMFAAATGVSVPLVDLYVAEDADMFSWLDEDD